MLGIPFDPDDHSYNTIAMTVFYTLFCKCKLFTQMPMQTECVGKWKRQQGANLSRPPTTEQMHLEAS